MKILCAIGIQGGAELVKRVADVAAAGPELVLLHVIDSGPRRTLEEMLRGPGGLRRMPPRPPAPPPPPGHEEARPLDAAEQAAGEAILDEARQAAAQAGLTAQAVLQKGRPEQLIVQVAREQGCRLVAIQASEGAQGRPALGPESVGHVARFVLDHAPCDVLLIREGE